MNRGAIKERARAALCGVYKYSGVMRMQEATARWTSGPFLAVLLFHRVTDAIPPDGLTVSTRFFRDMCRMLRADFTVVPLGEIVRLMRSGQPFPRRTLAITFDDCYRDNLFAARILAEHGLPACFCVPSGLVGTEQVLPWDRHLPPMPNLTWDDVREMARLGHEIGSHTVSHADLAQVSVERFQRELIESKKTIEDQVGRPVRWLAYPFGDRRHMRWERLPLVREAGYDGCLAAVGGLIHQGQVYDVLPREPAPFFRSLLHLELHLRGVLHWWYSLKRLAAT